MALLHRRYVEAISELNERDGERVDHGDERRGILTGRAGVIIAYGISSFATVLANSTSTPERRT